MIKAIIFDFAGVIATDTYWIWLRKKVPDLDKELSFFKDLSDQNDLGEISDEELFIQLEKVTKIKRNKIWQEFRQELVINYDLINVIKLLKQKFKIGLLSNYNHNLLESILTSNKLIDLFDKLIISSRHRIIKPDKKIFLIALKKLKVKAEEAIFVDDRQVNVSAAEKLGIESILFTSTNKLFQDLKKVTIADLSHLRGVNVDN